MQISSQHNLKKNLRRFLYKKRMWVFLFLFALLTVPTVLVLAVDYYVTNHRQELIATINQQLGLNLKVGHIDIVWRLHRPQLKLSNVSISLKEQEISVRELQLGIRIRETLKKSQIHLGGAEIVGLNLKLPQLFESQKSSPPTESAKITVQDLVLAWQNLATAIPHLNVSESTLILPVNEGESIIKVDSIEIKGSKNSGKILGAIRVNASKTAIANFDLNIIKDTGIQFRGDATLSEFPIPLIHTRSEDFALISKDQLKAACADYGSIPCMRLDQGKLTAEFILENASWSLSVKSFEGKAPGLSASGSVFVKAIDQGVFFDIDINSARGELAPVMAILDREWIGLDTFKWLLSNLSSTKAQNGLVKIKGATHIEKYEKFLISMDINSQELRFESSWPSINDIEGNLKITADQLRAELKKAKFADLALNTGEFVIPSFSTRSTLGLVKVAAKDKFSTINSTLQKTPLKETMDEVAKHCELSGAKDLDIGVELSIDFTEFEKNGIKYKVSTNTSGFAALHESKVFGVKNANLDFSIDGQSTKTKSDGMIDVKFSGSSSGRWDLAEKIYGHLKLDIAKPFLGLSAAISNNEISKKLTKEGVDIDLPDVKGYLHFTKQQTFNKLTANLERLKIPKSAFSIEKSSQPTPPVQQLNAQSEPANPFDPKILPAIDIDIKSLRFGDADFGAVQVKANRANEGLQQINGSIVSPKYKIEIQDGSWTGVEPSQAGFDIRGKLSSSNTGDMLQSLGIYEGLIEGKSDAEFNLTWSGAPWQFKTTNLRGAAKYKLLGGQLKAMDNFVMKIVDILTLKNIKFYEKGTKIISSQAEVVFESGAMKMVPLRLEMPSAKIIANGLINFVDDTISTEVGMELNIADTARVVTAGAIFGPFGAIASYFATDDFKMPGYEVFNKLTAFSYRLDGSITKPKISGFKSKAFVGGIEKPESE